MKTKLCLISCLLLLALTACQSAAPAAEIATPTVSTEAVPLAAYSDPFAYCAAVGQIDAPDARYTGPRMDEALFKAYLTAANLNPSQDYPEAFKQMTVWRCMEHQVYACNFGANIPCDSKANTDQTPTQAMADFCLQNPGSDFIPMSVTGHNVIYSWHCAGEQPTILDQIDSVDAAGYQASFWVALKPDSETPAEAADAAGQIVFYSNRGGDYNQVYRLEIGAAAPQQLTWGESNTFSGPFSPDGKRLLFTGFGLLHSYVGVMNADGSEPLDLSRQPDADDGFPAWSPDGRQIVFTSRRAGNNEIYVMDADGSNPRRLTNQPTDDFAPAWSPDGSRIAFLSDRDNQTGIYSIYTMAPDGTGLRRLTAHSGNDYTPAWSPDGSRLAFRSVQGGQSDIYLIDADGNGLTNLTNHPAEDWSPAWSPDGLQIAFQTNRDGNWEIYVMQADGSQPRNLTNHPADDQLPYWAPLAAKPDGMGLANPASVNCLEQGGRLHIEQRGELGSFGVCYFEDNRQCEEWALLNGACPVGGLKVTGYQTEAARFCAITGGQYTITENSGSEDEQGDCTFPDGTTCGAWDYYNGICTPGP